MGWLGNLFKSRAQREAERAAEMKMRMNMTQQKIRRYVHHCEKQAAQYEQMARDAARYNDDKGCESYLVRSMQFVQRANQFNAFLLKMRDVDMQAQSGQIVKDIADAIAAASEVMGAASMLDMTRVATDINMNIEKTNIAQEQLTGALETIDVNTSLPMMDQSVDVPVDLKEKVARRKAELMEEVVVDEKTAEKPAAEVNARIQEGLDELRKLK